MLHLEHQPIEFKLVHRLFSRLYCDKLLLQVKLCAPHARRVQQPKSEGLPHLLAHAEDIFPINCPLPRWRSGEALPPADGARSEVLLKAEVRRLELERFCLQKAEQWQLVVRNTLAEFGQRVLRSFRQSIH
eukprot:187156-Prymnesium_polylepis.1